MVRCGSASAWRFTDSAVAYVLIFFVIFLVTISIPSLFGIYSRDLMERRFSGAFIRLFTWISVNEISIYRNANTETCLLSPSGNLEDECPVRRTSIVCGNSAVPWDPLGVR